MVYSYSRRSQGDSFISKSFRVREFACKDGSDKILIDSTLVDVLQKIRDHFGKPVIITSAYRSPSHNSKVGGSSSSYHLKGMAADIKVSGVSAVAVATYAQTLTNGVGCYYYGGTEFVHVDTRPSVKHWLCSASGNYKYFTSNFMPTIRRGYNPGYKDAAVKFLQKKLGLGIDGKFGAGTERAVKSFQASRGLTADGIVGRKTWDALFR